MSWDKIADIIVPLIFFGVYFVFWLLKNKSGGEEGEAERKEPERAARPAPRRNPQAETPDFESARRMVEQMTRDAGGVYGGTSYSGQEDKYVYEHDSDNDYSARSKHKHSSGEGYMTASEMRAGKCDDVAVESHPVAVAQGKSLTQKLKEILEQSKAAEKKAGAFAENDAYALKDSSVKDISAEDAYKTADAEELHALMSNNKEQLRRAIIYAEIIGKPVSMRDPFERL